MEAYQLYAEEFGKEQFKDGLKEGLKKGRADEKAYGKEQYKEAEEKTEQHFLKTVEEKLKKEDPSLSDEEALLKAKNLLGISN